MPTYPTRASMFLKLSTPETLGSSLYNRRKLLASKSCRGWKRCLLANEHLKPHGAIFDSLCYTESHLSQLHVLTMKKDIVSSV